MRMFKALAAVSTLVAAAGAAEASISMSFADPIPGRQLHNLANGAGPGVGFMTYDQTAQLSFLFDGSEDSLPNHVFSDARMEMEMSIGAATTVGGITVAPVSGFFKIYDMSSGSRQDIITGIASAGSFVRISNTNSILFSDPDFTYASGPALDALIGPMTFIAPSEGVFTLTNVLSDLGATFINPDGTFRTFDANASFTGNTQAVPTPGALALAGLGGLCLARRRRA